MPEAGHYHFKLRHPHQPLYIADDAGNRREAVELGAMPGQAEGASATAASAVSSRKVKVSCR